MRPVLAFCLAPVACAAVVVLSLPGDARAQGTPAAPAEAFAPAAPTQRQGSAPADRARPPAGPAADAYGGAWSAPLMAFTPAGALPRWSLRAALGAEYQPYIEARDPVRPQLAVAFGLPWRITVELGARWLGGEATAADGISPHVAARVQLFGAQNGMGLVGALGARFKWVGFSGHEPELEFEYTMQYRHRWFEAGANAVFGQNVVNASEHDLEGRAFAVVRVVPALAVGVGGQARFGLSPYSLSSGLAWDLRGGLISNVTVGRFQFAMLLGASNYLPLPTHPGASLLAQGMVAYRFN